MLKVAIINTPLKMVNCFTINIFFLSPHEMRVGKEAMNLIAHQTPTILFKWDTENTVSISKLQPTCDTY